MAGIFSLALWEEGMFVKDSLVPGGRGAVSQVEPGSVPLGVGPWKEVMPPSLSQYVLRANYEPGPVPRTGETLMSTTTKPLPSRRLGSRILALEPQLYTLSQLLL